jgi:hypothetical protein
LNSIVARGAGATIDSGTLTLPWQFGQRRLEPACSAGACIALWQRGQTNSIAAPEAGKATGVGISGTGFSGKGTRTLAWQWGHRCLVPASSSETLNSV